MATTRTHIKINRKELKQPDEFQSFIANAQEFLLSNLQQVIVSSAIVLAAGALAVGIYYYEIHRDNIAGDRFYSAISELNNKNYTSGRNGLPEACRRRTESRGWQARALLSRQRLFSAGPAG